LSKHGVGNLNVNSAADMPNGHTVDLRIVCWREIEPSIAERRYPVKIPH
jgi:hypothetical protein